MGKYSVGDAIIKLHVAKIWARRGYPGRMMPHITETAVAVNVHKYMPDGIILVAEICVPMHLGVRGCEDMAYRVAELWAEDGGTVTFGGHRFDGKSGLYYTSVYGEWKDTEEEST